ncbi:MAG: BREX-3 system P-loop-containing protein BrxF [Synergistaceae bacterium]|jgi:hypothetical protein|nr:BREX-3 system P-loop-containing protein BrxF [Synergistaceae bacterium]
MARANEMGQNYYGRTLAAKALLSLSPPILLCSSRTDFEKAIADAGYQTVSLNLPLARALAGMTVSDISPLINDKIREALPQSEPVFLTDYEMLFDPRYKLDIMRLFMDLSRKNKLIVKWRGAVDGNTVTYSEQGFEDYQRIRISDYDVSVVI